MTGCVGKSTFPGFGPWNQFALYQIRQLRLRKADVAGLARIVQTLRYRKIFDAMRCEWRRADMTIDTRADPER